MSFKSWHIIFIAVFIFFVGMGLSAYFFVRQSTPEEILNFPVVKNALVKRAGESKKEFVDLLPQFLGFREPQTYLILFQNNTEMRPGGGFLGTYATVRVSHGKMEMLAVEGTEVLDKRTPATWKPTPPKMIQEKLGLDRWYFRDSNWSPDYPTNVQKALEFYKAEGGVAASEIDAVVAFTPTVLEELLKITGPLTIQGVRFDAQNVVRQLEHEVEFGFRDKGIAFENRKQIIQPFFHELMKKLGPDAILHTKKYFDLFDALAAEKHVLVYFFDENIQKLMKEKQWTGEVKSTAGDFLLWVDANLGALKTDHAMKRELSYQIIPEQRGNVRTFSAVATMKYIHTGNFDKFTSRYRTYARLYVPEGAQLKEAYSIDQNGKRTLITSVDQGKELGKQWFGVFLSIEPKEIKSLEFSYTLSQSVVDQIKGGVYTLLAQKQSGLENAALTLNLNFGTNIQSATPAEERNNWGDSRYIYITDFLVDKEVSISLK